MSIRVPLPIGDGHDLERLQRLIDDVPNGSHIVFPPGAVYRGGIGLFRGKRNLLVDGSGATFRGKRR